MDKGSIFYRILCIFALIMIAAGVSSLKRQLTISVCLANEAPYSASSFEGNPQHFTYRSKYSEHYADRRNGGQ